MNEVERKLRLIAEIAKESLINEVTLAPKPGLVDPYSQGSHKDMDYPLFLKSIEALTPYFYEYLAAGYCSVSERDLYLELRKIGRRAETSMLIATNQINTHKGANFSYAFILGALGKALQGQTLSKLAADTYQNVFHYVQEITAGIVERDFAHLEQKARLSYGEKLFLEFGITGIRGEAEEGYPLLKDKAIAFLRKNHQLMTQERYLRLMLYLISEVQDANLMHRGGISGWQDTQAYANRLRQQEESDFTALKRNLKQLDHWLIEKNLSPGGTADLLALSIFFDLLDNKSYYAETIN